MAALKQYKPDIYSRVDEKSEECIKKVTSTEAPYTDPFTFFADAIKGEIIVEPSDLSSLETNITVVEILEAARESSRTGKKVVLPR